MPAKTTERKAAHFLIQHPVALLTHARKVGKSQHNNFLGSPGLLWVVAHLQALCLRQNHNSSCVSTVPWLWKSTVVTAEGWKLLSRSCCRWHLHSAGFPDPPPCLRPISLYLQHRWDYRVSDTSCTALLSPSHLCVILVVLELRLHFCFSPC